MKRIILFTIAFIAFVGISRADDKDEFKKKFNPIMTAVTSQSISPDARAGGMGDVGAATDPDVFSQAWNPAKYPFTISRAGISLNYTPWLRKITSGIALLDAAGYVRIGDYQAVSGSVRYFTLGDVMTDDKNMTVRPYEFGVDVAYSRMLSEKLSAAIALRYIYSDISGHYDDQMKAGSAFAADLALYWNNYSYFIPTNLRLGASLMIPVNEFNRVSFSADVNKLLVPSLPLRNDGETNEDYNERVRREYYDMSSIKGMFKSFGDSPNGFKGELEEIQWGLGLEYTYNDQFSLRAGYHHESDSQGGRKFFTLGAGFRMNVLSIDAGYVVATNATNPLDQTLRVSLSFDMDGIKSLFSR